MSELDDFRRGLTYLECALGNSPEHQRMVIQLPAKAYNRLFRAAAQLMTEQSGGGVVYSPPPPEGKTWRYGFWLQGHWIERAEGHAPVTNHPE